jgi:hypothetical protein
VTESDPHLRASDADREAVAARLRDAETDGRLDTDELEDRLAKAYAAKTFGDLAPLTADLGSAAPPARTPAPGPVAEPEQFENASVRWNTWRNWAATSVTTIGIWALICVMSGSLLFFWPIFPVGFWGLSLLTQTISGNNRR